MDMYGPVAFLQCKDNLLGLSSSTAATTPDFHNFVHMNFKPISTHHHQWATDWFFNRWKTTSFLGYIGHSTINAPFSKFI